jgi:homoserine dehydrogenase
LVVNCTLENHHIKAKVEPITIDLNHSLAHITGTQNAVLIHTEHNGVLEFHGTGAGRWPCAESAFADLLALSNQVNRRQLHVNQSTHKHFTHPKLQGESLEEVV